MFAAAGNDADPVPPTPAGSPLCEEGETTSACGESNPDWVVPVQFNFSLDGGDNWFPLVDGMRTFQYQPCRPVCEYVTGNVLMFLIF